MPQRAAAVAKHQSQLSETPAHKSNGEKRIELRRKPTKKQRIREEKLKAQIARWQEQRRSENEKVEQTAARLREREEWEASEAARLHKEKHREYWHEIRRRLKAGCSAEELDDVPHPDVPITRRFGTLWKLSIPTSQ
mmetsp:Transcript_13304/g.26270  ORF Transcript_13304/g.26270 Transcript_13304/m.26270 type:complete len:137 (-) Transcript_13304:3-413(-)